MKLWRWWIVLVFVVSGPWFGVTTSPQWKRVEWMPFTSKENKPRDVIANVLLFVPLGWSFGASRPGRRGAALAIATGFATSLVAESLQVFWILRDPSATDLLTNTCGTALGVAGAALWRRRPLP